MIVEIDEGVEGQFIFGDAIGHSHNAQRIHFANGFDAGGIAVAVPLVVTGGNRFHVDIVCCKHCGVGSHDNLRVGTHIGRR